jgi:Transcriptional regulators of sugar metabolism
MEMLTEKRHGIILELLQEKRSITVAEIKDRLGISESTIRRDLNALDREGKLTKVFGGAVALDAAPSSAELSVSQKLQVNEEEKRCIARYAASILRPHDFVYLDAGTTTGYMLEYPMEKNVTFVTNAVAHARRLAVAGYRALLVGGELRGTTEAVVGAQAVLSIQEYHFTLGFFGANGISRRHGCTTPDSSEALVKKTALRQCGKPYVLADSAKFDEVSSVSFAGFREVEIISERIPGGYGECENVWLAK